MWSLDPALPRLSLEVGVLCISALAGIYVLATPKYGAWHPTVVAWVLVLPMMTGLVHGLVAAILLTGMVAIGVQVEIPERWGTLADAFIASGVVALLAGHLSDMRRSALAIAREKLDLQAQQLERQFRQYQVVRTSHALLTERTSAQEWSLSASVDAALRMVSEGPVARSAGALLALLESQAMVRVAAVYLQESAGRLSPRPIATLGLQGPVFSRHQAVRSAFQLGELVVPRSHLQPPQGATQEVVIAVPLVTSAGRVYGVVAVYELPFVATHDAHFRLIATLTSSVADALLEQAEAATQAQAVAAQPVLAVSAAAQPALAEPAPTQPPWEQPAPLAQAEVDPPIMKKTLHGIPQRVVAPLPSRSAPAAAGEGADAQQAFVEAPAVVARPVVPVRPLPAAHSISHALEGRLPLPQAFQMPAEVVAVAGLFSGSAPTRVAESGIAPLPVAHAPTRAEPGSAPRPIPAPRLRDQGTGSGVHEDTPSRVQRASGA